MEIKNKIKLLFKLLTSKNAILITQTRKQEKDEDFSVLTVCYDQETELVLIHNALEVIQENCDFEYEVVRKEDDEMDNLFKQMDDFEKEANETRDKFLKMLEDIENDLDNNKN